MKKNASTIPVVLGLLALAGLAGGTLLYSKRGTPPAPAPPAALASPRPPDNAPAIMPSPPPAPVGGTLHTATIFRVVSDNDGSHLESKTVDMPATKPVEPPSTQARNALNVMARVKDSPLPDGTEARSVTITGETATVDFNVAFKENFHGGDEAEALALNSVLATMGQFAGVHRVQITVEGKTIDSLGGNQSLTHALPVPQQTAAREVAP